MFGRSVSMSADGNTALIGAFQHAVGEIVNQGAAYVFVRSSSGWTQQAKLIAMDGERFDLFGVSVSLSADGSTALIGSYADDIGAQGGQGSAYVFVRSGSDWTQQAKLIASDGAGLDTFGWSVNLSDDGNTALVGANHAAIGTHTNQGSAYIFVRSGSAWTEQAKLAASDGSSGDRFGYSVSLSADGSTALVGASYATIGTHTNQGSAYIFVRSGSAWTQQAKLTASDGQSDDIFSYSVSLSADGSTALIGKMAYDIGAEGLHRLAYIFVRSGSHWTQQAKLTAPDGQSDDTWGYSVSLSADGSTALIGARKSASAYIFTRSDSTWTMINTIFRHGVSNFGWKVDMNDDGSTILISRYFGSAWVFDLESP